MSDYNVYLSGPMNGLTLHEANAWRGYIESKLPDHIKCLNPFRGKELYLLSKTNNGKYVLGDDREETPLTSARGITVRDRYDSIRCDVLFVNVLGSKKVSIGTVMEIAWSDSVRIPIILVMEKEGNIHEHPILTEVASYRVETLDEGISVLKAILTP